MMIAFACLRSDLHTFIYLWESEKSVVYSLFSHREDLRGGMSRFALPV